MREIFLSAIAALLLITGSVHAATLISTAAGNINATATWAIVDTAGTGAFLPNDGGWGAFTANSNWTTSDSSISMDLNGPGWAVTGWFVVDLTSNKAIGTASTFPRAVNNMTVMSSTLNLQSAASNGGSGGDLIGLAPANFGYTTLTTSFQHSASFNLATETVQGFAVKLASSPASGATGTLTAEIVDASNANAVVCHQTVNIADLPVNAQLAYNDGGWVPFTCIEGTFATNNAHNYQVWVEVSATTTPVSLWTNGTAANFSHLVITTTTQVGGPAASDNYIVAGALSGAGTHTGPFTVAVNTTANINYGSNANTWQSPSIAVSQYGILAFNNAASTNYLMEVAGPVRIYKGGAFTIGTNASPIPATSTATLTLNSAAEDDTCIVNGGTLNIAGVARTAGKNVVRTTLSATANSGATTLSVNDDTGWLSGDQVAIAGTLPSMVASTQLTEVATLSGGATSNSLPVSALTSNHTAQTISGTGSNGVAYNAPMDADVVLLTRNVVVQGASNALPGCLYTQPNSITSIDWARFKWIGGLEGGQAGITVDTGPGGSYSRTHSVIDGAIDGGLYFGFQNLNWGGPSAASPLLDQNNAMYNVGQTNSSSFAVLPTINQYWTIDQLTQIHAGSGFQYNALVSGTGNLTNITCADCSLTNQNANFDVDAIPPSNDHWFNGQQINLSITRSYGLNGNTFGPVRVYASNGNGLILSSGNPRGIMSGYYGWNNNQRVELLSSSYMVFDPYYDIEPSNNFGVYCPSCLGTFVFRNGIIGYFSGASPAGASAFTLDGNDMNIEFDNMELCPSASEIAGMQATGCVTSSISIDNDYLSADQLGTAQIVAKNTVLGGVNDYPFLHGQNGWAKTAVVQVDCPGCAHPHVAYVANGTLSYDNTIHYSASVPYSARLTPEIGVFHGYISDGTSGTPGYEITVTDFVAGELTDNSVLVASGIITGTKLVTYPQTTAGFTGTVNVSQAIGTSGSPALFTVLRDTAPDGRAQSAPLNQGVKVAIKSGNTMSICVPVRESSHLDSGGVDYAGDPPRLLVRADPSMGILTDTVLHTYSSSDPIDANGFRMMCGTSPVAPRDGMFEYVVDADMTAAAAVAYAGTPGWINIGSWQTANGSISPQGSQQFWNLGVPPQWAAPSLAGGYATNP